MEVLFTPEFYIFRRGDTSLWFKRSNNSDTKATLKSGYDFNQLPNLTCLGLAHGLIGKFGHDNLIVIRQNQCVGTIPGVKGSEDEVYRVKRIAIIQLNDVDPIASELCLEPCTLHDNNPLTGISSTEIGDDGIENHSSGANLSHSFSSGAIGSSVVGGSGGGNNTGAALKTWNSLKSATSSVKSGSNLNKSPRGSFAPGKEKGERRLINEVLKMFNNTDSFYYSPTGDISNSIQMKHVKAEGGKQETSETVSTPTAESIKDSNTVSDTGRKNLWVEYDERFIWNRFMIDSLIDECEDEITNLPDLNFWMVPLIQGFFQSETCYIDGDKLDDSDLEFREYQMILISRRSRFRAGTRYKRRGLDEDGNCANYVETEQIFKYGSHVVSFVQVRGSVPIFWSQPGHAYRPPPRIDRSEEETQKAFETHFLKEFNIYGREVIINLIERWGRERVVGEAYLNHTINFDSPLLTYVSFDFHERCRGMKFENVSILISSIKEIIRDMKYCWIDDQGVIQLQDGVFRVNCIDCLDRTNIAQTAIARTVMDTQFSKLGVLCPDSELPPNCRRIFQIMWANNGDSISRQYAGTNALKGDYTRTGERRLAGMVKDSYNSASRYLQNRFKDAYRQAAIDTMQGNPISDSDLRSPDSENVYGEDDDEEDIEHHERVKQVIEDCKKILIPENEVILGGWPLIDAEPSNTDSSNQSSMEMDTVLILTKDCYYVAEYDDQTDRITKYQKVLLEDLEKIECGPEPGAQLLFSSLSSKLQKQSYCIRFHYLVNGQTGYFHMFRPTNTRFFNNMAIPVRTPQESIDSLKAICESFKVALCVKSLNVPLYEGRLEKRKSKTVSFASKQPTIHGNLQPRKVRHYTHSSSISKGSSSLLPRNISDGNLLNLKNVGSRALSNVSCQLARFKGKLTGNARSNPHLALGTVSEQRLESIQSFGGVATSIASSEEDIYDDEWEGAVTTGDISEDESLRQSKRTSRLLRDQQASIASNASSVFLTERTLSSDYSECSDLEDTDDAVLSSLCEEPRSLPFQNATSLSLAGNDTLLESCGILTISPPLKPDYDELGLNEAAIHREKNRKSLLKDVDDFVIDAMNKAGLKQLHRKASESLTSLPLRGKYPSLPLSSTSSQLNQHQQQPRAPQIEISDSMGGHDVTPPSPTGQPRTRKLSKSSEDIEALDTLCNKTLGNTSSVSCAALSVLPVELNATIDDPLDVPSSSKSSSTLQISSVKMKQSQSEMTLGQSQDNRLALDINSLSNSSSNPLSSPILMKKDLILSPISRIAKGVHSFGLNLRSHYSNENTSNQVFDPKQCGKHYEKTNIIFI